MELMERRRILLNTPHINIVTGLQFVTDMVAPLESLVINFSPIQDLHGYDSPWPAGGGANIWDEEWELGSYSNTNGEPTTYTDRIRGKNRFSVLPNTEYFFKTSNGLTAGNAYFYDVNDVFISARTTIGNTAIVTPNNCKYMRIAMGLPYGATYNHDIAINYPSTVTTYSPYENICPIEGRTDMVVRHIGKNLFDRGNPLVKNKYVSADGSIQSSISYQYSDYYTIVQPNTNYVFSGKIVTGSTYNTISFYDDSKNFIGRHVPPRGGTGAVFTTPVNCYYIRFNIGLDAELDTIQLEVGSEATEYEPYTEPYYPLGKNLADPNSVVKGGYYSGSGAWSANTVSATTGLIRVKPNTTYVSSIFDNAGTRLNACVATLWDSATTCTGQITTQKFTTGSQTQYVRIRNFDAQGSYITNDDFKFQLEEGETPTAFEEYQGIGYKTNWGKNLFDQSLMKDQTAWNIIKIYAPVGTELIMSTNQPAPAQSGLLTYFMYSGGQQSSNENCYINHPVARTVPEIGYVQVAQRNRDNISSVEDWNYQIEIGSNETEYQPYVGTVYGGTVDLVSGTLTVTHTCIDLGDFDWSMSSAGHKFYTAITPRYSKTNIDLISSVYKLDGVGNSSRGYYGDDGTIRYYAGTQCEFYIHDERYNSVEEFKEGAKGIQVAYRLETPITYQLTPQQIRTLKGTNNLFSNSNGEVTTSYWTHLD